MRNQKNPFLLIVGILLFFSVTTPVFGSGNSYSINISTVQPVELLRGDPIVIPINQHDSPQVQVWTFGKQYLTISTEILPGNSTEFIIRSASSENLPAGRLIIFLQYPGKDNKFDIVEDNQTHQWINLKNYGPGHVLFTTSQGRNLLGDDAPNMLIESLDHPSVDDNYSISIVNISDTFISINPIKNHYIGENITISGVTNVPAGETIYVELSRGFLMPKINQTDICAQGGPIEVQAGSNGVNFYSITVNSSDSPPTRYDVFVDTCFFNRGCSQASTSFNLLERPEPLPLLQTLMITPTSSKPDVPASQITTISQTPSKSVFIPLIIPIISLGIVVCFCVFRKSH